MRPGGKLKPRPLLLHTLLVRHSAFGALVKRELPTSHMEVVLQLAQPLRDTMKRGLCCMEAFIQTSDPTTHTAHSDLW